MGEWNTPLYTVRIRLNRSFLMVDGIKYLLHSLHLPSVPILPPSHSPSLPNLPPFFPTESQHRMSERVERWIWPSVHMSREDWIAHEPLNIHTFGFGSQQGREVEF